MHKVKIPLFLWGMEGGGRIKRATSMTAVERRIKRAEMRRLCGEREGGMCGMEGPRGKDEVV